MTRHVHRYQRKRLGADKNYTVYACNLPGCNHYLERTLVKGKLSLCNRCGTPMIMTPFQLTLAKPHCLDCTRRKDETYEKFKELLTENVEGVSIPD